MMRPKLRVVAGADVRRAEWLDFPSMVAAKSPWNRDVACSLRVSAEMASKSARVGRKQPAFNFWSLIKGKAPPVLNVRAGEKGKRADENLVGVDAAHACFRGLKRPLGDQDSAENYVVYVLKPQFLYRYRPSLACLAEKVAVPDCMVFVVYAKLDVPVNKEALIQGVITHWDFVLHSEDDRLLPEDHQTRYAERLW